MTNSENARALGSTQSAAEIAAIRPRGHGVHRSPVTRGGVFRRVGVAALAAATLVAVTVAPGVSHASSPGPDRPELQKAAQEVVDVGFLGAQLRVHDEQGDWVGSAGQRELGSTQAPKTNGLSRVGSATKAFTSAVTLQLVDEGKVELDAPAADYLPGWDLDSRITVRMLLQHTSGIFNFHGQFNDKGELEPGIPVAGKEWVDIRFKNYSREKLVEFALSKPLKFKPGTNWSYSNTNYVLIRFLIENVTGNSLVDEMKQRILKPLKLKGTVMPEASPKIPGPHAHAYYRYQDEDGKWKTADVTDQNPTWVSTGGDMISTTKDLSRFLSELLDGEFFSDELLDEMLKPDPNSPIGYGLGLSVMDNGPDCGGTLVNINGGLNGFGALTYSTLDGGRTMSALVTGGDADIDPAEAGGKAAKVLLDEVFCGGKKSTG